MADEDIRDIEQIDTNFASAEVSDGLKWYDCLQLDIEGKGWSDTVGPYDRLPARAEAMVRPEVWQLAGQSAGMCVRFITDAESISARWTLRHESWAMSHMTATGADGLDLYVKDGDRWRFLAVGRPEKSITSKVSLVEGLTPGERQYMLYLPLYNGVKSVSIGLKPRASFTKAPRRRGGADKPICFYGTSVTQGGCASRPAMAYPAILGRRLDRPVINLGFSGNGRMEAELAELLAELDPCVYVLDCLPNMETRDVTERIEPFVETLRGARPTTPIVLVESITYQDAAFVPARSRRSDTANEELRKAFGRLRGKGTPALHYIAGGELYGDDGEATVDGVHATDLGFMRIADVMESILRPLV